MCLFTSHSWVAAPTCHPSLIRLAFDPHQSTGFTFLSLPYATKTWPREFLGNSVLLLPGYNQPIVLTYEYLLYLALSAGTTPFNIIGFKDSLTQPGNLDKIDSYHSHDYGMDR